MPVPPSIAGLGRLTVLLPVGDVQQLWIPLQAVERGGVVGVQDAEISRKCYLLFRCPLHATEQQEVVFVQTPAYFLDVDGAQLPSDVDSKNLCAERARQSPNRCHGESFFVVIGQAFKQAPTEPSWHHTEARLRVPTHEVSRDFFVNRFEGIPCLAR